MTSPEVHPPDGGQKSSRRASRTDWPTAVVGAALLGVAFAVDPAAARAATAQVWPAFVLVTGLILVGLVCDADGLFAWVGHRLAARAPGSVTLFVGAAVLVAGVTAVLNLDTSVVFVTPVLVYAARSRGTPRM